MLRSLSAYLAMVVGIVLLLASAWLALHVSTASLDVYRKWNATEESITGDKTFVQDNPESFYDAIVTGRLVVAGVLGSTGALLIPTSLLLNRTAPRHPREAAYRTVAYNHPLHSRSLSCADSPPPLLSLRCWRRRPSCLPTSQPPPPLLNHPRRKPPCPQRSTSPWTRSTERRSTSPRSTRARWC